jgi:hypothetical protein
VLIEIGDLLDKSATKTQVANFKMETISSAILGKLAPGSPTQKSLVFSKNIIGL